MTSGDRVAQLYPQALGTHFSCLLRHAWVTVGLFFNTGHHTGADHHHHRYYHQAPIDLGHLLNHFSVKCP
jgi:hypothetical protein